MPQVNLSLCRWLVRRWWRETIEFAARNFFLAKVEQKTWKEPVHTGEIRIRLVDNKRLICHKANQQTRCMGPIHGIPMELHSCDISECQLVTTKWYAAMVEHNVMIPAIKSAIWTPRNFFWPEWMAPGMEMVTSSSQAELRMENLH